MPAGFPSTNYWADEPRVGFSKNSLFIAADMRAFDSNGTFQYSKLWMIPKANVYQPDGAVPPENVRYYFWYGLQNADGTPAYQVIPAKTYDYNDPTAYLVSAHWNGGSELTLWNVNDAKPSIAPGVKGMGVATQPYLPPPAAPQKPTATVPAPLLINTWNAWLVNAVYQRPTHHVAGQCWLMFGMRLGGDPRVVVTTTPKPTKIIRDLLDVRKTCYRTGIGSRGWVSPVRRPSEEKFSAQAR